mgnify:CR=1 FL=1
MTSTYKSDGQENSFLRYVHEAREVELQVFTGVHRQENSFLGIGSNKEQNEYPRDLISSAAIQGFV